MDDEKKRKERIATRKLVKEAADFLFRVVQMWIVLALVVFFQRQSGSGLATAVMFALTAALLIYCYVTPINLLEEWEVAQGREGHALMYVGVLAVTVLVGFPLLFSDPILNEMNRITHSVANSPVAHAPHGGQ